MGLDSPGASFTGDRSVNLEVRCVDKGLGTSGSSGATDAFYTLGAVARATMGASLAITLGLDSPGASFTGDRSVNLEDRCVDKGLGCFAGFS